MCFFLRHLEVLLIPTGSQELSEQFEHLARTLASIDLEEQGLAPQIAVKSLSVGPAASAPSVTKPGSAAGTAGTAEMEMTTSRSTSTSSSESSSEQPRASAAHVPHTPGRGRGRGGSRAVLQATSPINVSELSFMERHQGHIEPTEKAGKVKADLLYLTVLYPFRKVVVEEKVEKSIGGKLKQRIGK